jgi:hypothetical protein
MFRPLQGHPQVLGIKNVYIVSFTVHFLCLSSVSSLSSFIGLSFLLPLRLFLIYSFHLYLFLFASSFFHLPPFPFLSFILFFLLYRGAIFSALLTCQIAIRPCTVAYAGYNPDHSSKGNINCASSENITPRNGCFYCKYLTFTQGAKHLVSTNNLRTTAVI